MHSCEDLTVVKRERDFSSACGTILGHLDSQDAFYWTPNTLIQPPLAHRGLHEHTLGLYTCIVLATFREFTVLMGIV